MNRETNMEPIGNPNNWHIAVYPRRAGDFGYASFSAIEYDSEEAKSLAEDMRNEIGRHVNRVLTTEMIYDSWICPQCKSEFDSYEEAKNCDH